MKTRLRVGWIGLLSMLALANAWSAVSGASPSVDPGNAEFALDVTGVLSSGKPLVLRMVTAWGAVQNVTATEPVGMDFTTGAGTIATNNVRVVVNGSGRTPGTLWLQMALAGSQVSGTHTGRWGKLAVSGTITGTAAPGKGILGGGSQPPLELVKAAYFGTAQNDNFEGAVAGPDGCLYLVGNVGTHVRELPGGVAPVTLGNDVADPLCGCGFVLKLSPDASNVLAYVELGLGVLHATAIAVTDKHVYVGGYASDGLESLLKERNGLLPGYPLRAEQQLIKAGQMMAANGFAADKPDPVAGRPWLGRLGAPCVLRFSPDLKNLEKGTYLEGWEQVYDKKRICGRFKGCFPEFFWQPIGICPLTNGDVAVAHDGGYFRMLTDKDRETAARIEDAAARAKFLERLCFYDVADHVSRLSGDLSRRVWKTDIYTPPTVQAVANQVKNGWFLPHFGNPRTHRMRMDAEGRLWVAGWSASATSQEPWWSPFLWRLDSQTGQPTRKLYEYDPMSGGGNRMGGEVADTALLSVAIENDGNLLTALVADGGNCVMGKGPLGNAGQRMTGPVIGPGLGGSPAHFWGQAHRVDGKTFEGLGGARSGPWGWTIDVAGLPGGNFLALGRWNAPLPWTPNAWWTNGALANPNAFLRVVGPDYNTLFWTAMPGVRPYELMPIGGGRYILVGFAAQGTAPTKDSLVPKAPGGEDAFFAIVKWK